MHIENRLRKELSKRLDDNNLRSLKINHGVDFSSNDYLGFARNKKLHQLITDKSAEFQLNGSTGSRLLSGNNEMCEKLESQLAGFFKAEACLIFNSGYTANLALISSIAKRGDTIVYDELAHACIKDGARLTLAERYSFKHNDLEDLKSKLNHAKGQIFIIVESVYSMDGDEAPLKEIIKIAKSADAQLIVDEAHATGIYGGTGGGLSSLQDMEDQIFARIYTFGKAMGVHGAVIAGSNVLKDYIVNFARPFIYTTALPPHSLVAIKESFNYLIDNIDLQNRLKDRVAYFNLLYTKYLSDTFTKIDSSHPIQSIVISGNNNVKKAAEAINNKGFDVRPILSPTVKSGQERLRICLHTFNTDDEIYALIDTLANLK
ncbi:MAG: pyridoxal phosphate-dependent aminotransferase family protein [Fulvivirga sp.]